MKVKLVEYVEISNNKIIIIDWEYTKEICPESHCYEKMQIRLEIILVNN